MQCCQVALSTMDLTRTHWWYQRALGFLEAGERRQRGGAAFAAVPDLPEATLDVWCLVGRRAFMQIEMIEFTRPRMRPRSSSWRRSDVGYTTVGIHVSDFEGALERIDRIGGCTLTAPIGRVGRRRVCLFDPDNTLIELMEDYPCADLTDAMGSERLPAIAYVSMSVRNLDRVSRFWIDVLGCVETTSSVLHDPQHETLWGLRRAVRETMIVRSHDVLFEFVNYQHPASRGRPAGYLLSDQGILNVAFGSTDKQEFDETYERALSRGFRGFTKPWTVPDVATVVYLTDALGLSVELLHINPEATGRMGFVPNPVTSVTTVT